MQQMKSPFIVTALLIFAFTLILNIRTDGYFPFSAATNVTLLYASSLAVVVIAFFLVWLAAKLPELKHKWLDSIENYLGGVWLGVIGINLLLYAGLTLRNDRNFGELSSLNFGVLVVSLVGIIIAWLMAYRSKQVRLVLLTSLATLIVLSLLQIAYFPLTAKQADLMPIITAQAEALLEGENIYQFYVLDNGVKTQAVRQPGMAVFYLPAVILNIDPRFISLVYLLLTTGLLYRLVYQNISQMRFDNRFILTSLLISLFIFFPYRLVRLDLYEPPFWLLFVTVMLLLKEKKYIATSILWGLGIFTQVWFWLFTPFYCLYLLRALGWQKAVVYSLLALATGVVLLAPFILAAPDDYYYHVFGYYEGVVQDGISYPNNYYLTPLIQYLGLKQILQFGQIVAVGIVGLVALRSQKTLEHLLLFLTLAFLTFIQFNSLSWNYFYINLVYFLVVYLLNRISQAWK